MIRQIPVDGFDKNFSYFVIDEKGKSVAVVDPGDFLHLEKEIAEDKLTPKMIVLTHSHDDHQVGVREMVRKYGIPVYIHKFGRGRVDIFDEFLVLIEDGDTLKIGNMNLKVIHTPGHIDDACCYYLSPDQAVDGVPKLITGDTLFVEGCGRADLRHSNAEDLFKSLQIIKSLPAETKIYPGHNYGSKPISTIAEEKLNNPYLLCDSLEEFLALRLPL